MATDENSTTAGPEKIKEWRSIVTLIVFVITNIIVLFPFHIPIRFPRALANAIANLLSALRIRPPRPKHHRDDAQPLVLKFPVNFITAPLIADLFLLAILAIGREEVYGGTISSNHIEPYDIMIFFFSLAYIAISIDASGLIRYLAFKVLQKGGSAGHLLFFYLYAFFMVLGSFIGNDPIILSGTAFLAYMTRVSSNIVHPRAWIHSQFAVANIASAILVSSNPTNLVLAGAFNIQFLHYTANMIVPVIATAIVLFPFLLYIIFNDEKFVPSKINIHELSEEQKAKKPVNPNIPNARGKAEEEENQHYNDDQGKQLSLEEIMNPFLDKGGAMFGAIVMAATLVSIIAFNAASQTSMQFRVFWVTLPAAVVMLSWDLGFGWLHRHKTRKIAENGRKEVEALHAARQASDRNEKPLDRSQEGPDVAISSDQPSLSRTSSPDEIRSSDSHSPGVSTANTDSELQQDPEKPRIAPENPNLEPRGLFADPPSQEAEIKNLPASEKEVTKVQGPVRRSSKPHRYLTTILAERYRWSQETFPTAAAVLSHLPYALIPFSFCMFILVQALVSKGWIQVFAYGWDHWVTKTGTVGAVGGMGFLSVILCNFAGTNIGTTILLCRVIQAWVDIHDASTSPITQRTFWATVYAMAVGVNYGAFSTAFSASLAGMLWRDILARKHIHVKQLDFARVNLPIIAISMTVGLAVLIGEVYITRSEEPYIP
ncbi:hypothetical protein JX265_004655 [Neoarthrinium moseri]|uniref:Citrate transporter-like domain-containing protein n=1 Tax=Neoarthrinium moseri TaxID=1658444 RepID=A0A9Q0AN90_9PEZI|nr:hypothetical protein JX265_004655 [Neoarthrinium moseri]